MKLFKFSILNFIAIILLFPSCSENKTAEVLTDEEVVEIIESSISRNTYGLSEQAFISARLAAETSMAPEVYCSIEQDSSVMVNSNVGAIQDYSFQADFDYELICNGLFPQALEFRIETSGQFTTPRVHYTGTTDMNSEIDQLVSGDEEYRVNGAFVSIGTTTIGINNQNKTVSSTLSINVTNLKMDKVTYRISRGLCAFTMNVTGVSGNSETKTGAITFNGNQSATIMLNGEDYDIQL